MAEREFRNFRKEAWLLGTKPDVARENVHSVAVLRFTGIKSQVNLITFIRTTSYYTGKKN